MKYKRSVIIMILIMCLCILTMSGCQLAKVKESSEINEDKLCGVLITVGTPNRTLTNALRDKKIKLNKKGEIELTGGDILFDENKVAGRRNEDKNTVEFDSLTGYYLGIHREQDEKGEYYNSVLCDSVLSDVKFELYSSDEMQKYNCEATLYVNTEFNKSVYLNPVYQTNDHNYYVLMGNSSGVSATGGGIGSSFANALSSSITEAVDRISKTEQSSYTVNVVVVNEIENTEIKEMNSKDELIRVIPYLSDSPEEYRVLEDTAYVIVEETLSVKGDENVKRSVYVPLPEGSEGTSNQHWSNIKGADNVVERKKIKFITY